MDERLQVRALTNSFAESEGAALTWRTDQRYSGLNIGVLGIFHEPMQRRALLDCAAKWSARSFVTILEGCRSCKRSSSRYVLIADGCSAVNREPCCCAGGWEMQQQSKPERRQ